MDPAQFSQFGARREIPLFTVETHHVRGRANCMKYRVKNFLGLKAELAGLLPEDRNSIEPILRETKCWDASIQGRRSGQSCRD
jgi:hypothetical protein